MKWFKKDFFEYMDKPICTNCNTSDYMKVLDINGAETEEEKKWCSFFVEDYECEECT